MKSNNNLNGPPNTAVVTDAEPNRNALRRGFITFAIPLLGTLACSPDAEPIDVVPVESVAPSDYGTEDASDILPDASDSSAESSDVETTDTLSSHNEAGASSADSLDQDQIVDDAEEKEKKREAITYLKAGFWGLDIQRDYFLNKWGIDADPLDSDAIKEITRVIHEKDSESITDLPVVCVADAEKDRLTEVMFTGSVKTLQEYLEDLEINGRTNTEARKDLLKLAEEAPSALQEEIVPSFAVSFDQDGGFTVEENELFFLYELGVAPMSSDNNSEFFEARRTFPGTCGDHDEKYPKVMGDSYVVGFFAYLEDIQNDLQEQDSSQVA